ncbi:hypothetical protein [Microvirga arsenatis]|uniref:Uncharacterized protein n=1 Tax=Microvirga arsenatis TaxID=2692265 RepID=A0ABW9YUD2_9HYPH|nr:hypothetical protein [Microvirga arsenatis]NBJ09338.1 hypothetical protein [Microvirga arsenatis]NBJ23804.1 hypothetical protein [Microvirga arsenatis]
MARKLREQFQAAGLGPREYEVIDHHARGDAPPHLHWALKGQKVAEKYRAFLERQRAQARALRPRVPAQTQPSSFEQPVPTPEGLIRDVPSANSPGGGNRTSYNDFGGPSTTININGGSMDHHQMAASVQRHISAVWTRRTNDLETDIA